MARVYKVLEDSTPRCNNWSNWGLENRSASPLKSFTEKTENKTFIYTLAILSAALAQLITLQLDIFAYTQDSFGTITLIMKTEDKLKT